VKTSKEHATDDFIRVAFPTSATAAGAFPFAIPAATGLSEKDVNFHGIATLDPIWRIRFRWRCGNWARLYNPDCARRRRFPTTVDGQGLSQTWSST